MLDLTYKDLLSATAIILTIIAFIPYIRAILSGETKPHVFSWVIWGSTTFVIFLAQLADKGGAGAWPIGLSGIITMGVAYLAYVKRGEITITRSDWVFFLIAMTAIPCWYITENPLWAVIILVSVDVIGFFPTLRKSYHNPFQENVTLHAVMVFRNIFAAIALENYSLTTLLFPVAVAICASALVIVILIRRSTMKRMQIP